MKYIFLICFFSVVVCFFAFQTNASSSYPPRLERVYVSDTAYGGIDSFPEGTIDTLVAAGTNEIHVNGRIQDSDGYFDIDHVEATFYRSGVDHAVLCSENGNDCYRVAECDLLVDDYYHQQYDCVFELWYYADATDFGSQYPGEEWSLFVEVFDGGSYSDYHATTRKEISSFLAVDISGTINYGDLVLGDQTTAENNAELVVSQAGNTKTEIEVLSTGDMVCESGIIPIENQSWSIEDVDFEQGVVLTDTSTETGLELDYKIHGDTTPAGTLYWNLLVPELGVGGECEGTVSVTAANS
jgi:hypothetical protein